MARFWFWRRGGPDAREGSAAEARIPAAELRDWIRSRLGEATSALGFRATVGSPDGWVRPCGEGAFQLIQVSWVMRFSQICVIASLGFGHHLAESTKLFLRLGRGILPELGKYGENRPRLRRQLEALRSSKKHIEWKCSREGWPVRQVEEMVLAIQRDGIPYLERFRSREEIFAEVRREHLARKAPSALEELRFSCDEFCYGQRASAVARVEGLLRRLAGEPPARTETHRRIGEALLAHFRSQPPEREG